MNEILLGFIEFFKTKKPTIKFRNLLASIASKTCLKITIPQDCAECVLNPFLDELYTHYYKPTDSKRIWGITYVRHTICEAKDTDSLLNINFNEVQNILNLDIPMNSKKTLKFEDLILAFSNKEYYPDTYQGDYLLKCIKPHKLYWESHIELSNDIALFAIKRQVNKGNYNEVPIILPQIFRGLDLNGIICGSGTHYWCYARRGENEWYELNDNRFIKMDILAIIDKVKKNCVLVLYENMKHKKKTFLEPFGIENGGNFCYQNAALQLILTSPHLKGLIYEFAKTIEIPISTKTDNDNNNNNNKQEEFQIKMKLLNVDLEHAIRAIQNAWENEIDDDQEYIYKKSLQEHRDNLKTIENLITDHMNVHDREVELMRLSQKKRTER